MPEPSRAIFVSYASQDAAPVKRLCESLRAAGIEVWFDVEGGLETGDEWDAKIRRQIKECVLFLPVISANTQARDEGYFRIEWDLAAERARGIASGVPFILPIVIDDTREPDALVPDRFRSVQWTRARDGELSPETVAKFAKLWSHRLGVAKQRAASAVGAPAPEGSPAVSPEPAPARRLQPIVLGGLAFAVLAGAGVWWWSARSAAPAAAAAPASSAVLAASAAPAAGDFPRDAELRRAFELTMQVNAIREDLLLAEEIAQRVVERRPADPEAVTIMAHVQAAIVLRNFDFTAGRTALARRYCERAVQLAPEQPLALSALALFLRGRGNDLGRAEELSRRAVQLAPQVVWHWRVLSQIVRTVRPEEGIAIAEQNVARFPEDALVRYELSLAYRDASRYDECERELDATIARAPVSNAIDWKARFALMRGDLPGMKTWLERMPARARSEERAVLTAVTYAFYSGETDFGLSALGRFSETWFYDAANYNGPKALLEGLLLQRKGSEALARAKFEAALSEIRRNRAERPNDLSTHAVETMVLIGLGRLDEARVTQHTSMEQLRRPLRAPAVSLGLNNFFVRALQLGERREVLGLARELAAEPESRRTMRRRFEMDPRLQPFRGDAELAAIFAEPSAPVAVPAKPATEGEQLAARAIAITENIGFTRDDLVTGAELARRATEKDPDSARAWGARAWIEAAWIMRTWDLSPARRQEAQSLANRALSLDPNDPFALYALSYVFSRQGALDQAEVVIRKAAAAAPDNPRIARTLGSLLVRAGKVAEATRHLEALTVRFPQDPLIRYELALLHVTYGVNDYTTAQMDAAARRLDEAIALRPFASALLLRGTIAATWHDDFKTLREKFAQLAELPLAERIDDRTVAMTMWGSLIDGQYDQVAVAGRLTTRAYFEDAVLAYPVKSWLLAQALERQGKPNLARTQWQDAEKLLRQRLAENSLVGGRRIELACTLARLGQRDEALALIGEVEPAWREELVSTRAVMLAQAYAALGNAPKAIEYLRRVVDRSVYTTRHALRRDPWWDGIRESAEFNAMLAGLPPQP